MAKMVLLAQHLEIDANVLNQWINKVELTAEVEEKDVTVYTSLGWKESLGGLASGSLAVDVKQDFAAAAINDLLWPLFLARVPVSFLLRTDQAAVGPSNPQWTGLVLITDPGMIGGTVGDEANASVTWPTSGAVTRATA